MLLILSYAKLSQSLTFHQVLNGIEGPKERRAFLLSICYFMFILINNHNNPVSIMIPIL